MTRRGRRSTHANYRREADRIVSQAALRDPELNEAVNRLQAHEISNIMQRRIGSVDVDAIIRFNVGEVLKDSRGSGTLQRAEE